MFKKVSKNQTVDDLIEFKNDRIMIICIYVCSVMSQLSHQSLLKLP